MKRIFAGFIIIWLVVLSGEAQTKSTDAETTVFVNVSVIPMNTERALKNQTVIVRQGMIVGIGPAEKVKVPKNALRIDGAGKFLIPGLWDMHVHLVYAGEDGLPIFLKFGITNVRDMGGDYATIRVWKEKIARREISGPQIFAAGSILESAAYVSRLKGTREILKQNDIEPPPPEIEMETAPLGVGNKKDAMEAINKLKNQHVDFIKFRTIESRETFFAIAEEAKKAGLMFVGHAPLPQVTLRESSDAGQKSIEHMFFFDSALGKLSPNERAEIYKDFVKNKTAFVPTIVSETSRIASDAEIELLARDVLNGKNPLSRYSTALLRKSFRRDLEIQLLGHRLQPPKGEEEEFQKNLEYLREMHRAGVRLMPGTDLSVLMVFPGYSLHKELEYFVEKIGMSPYEALRSATLAPAEFFGLQKTQGTIEKGKNADLVLLDADPLSDIKNTMKIAGVFSNNKYQSK